MKPQKCDVLISDSFLVPKKNSDNFPLEARTGLQAEESIVASEGTWEGPLGTPWKTPW